MEQLAGTGDLYEGATLLCEQVRYRIIGIARQLEDGAIGLERISGTLQVQGGGGTLFELVGSGRLLTLHLEGGRRLDCQLMGYNPFDDKAKISGAGAGLYPAAA